MRRSKEIVSVEGYVLDVLMRDLVGHDKQPAAFMVYLHLYGLAARHQWRPQAASLRDIAETTGLSKSAVQTALRLLRCRELVKTRKMSPTGKPEHRVLRHWARPMAGSEGSFYTTQNEWAKNSAKKTF